MDKQLITITLRRVFKSQILDAVRTGANKKQIVAIVTEYRNGLDNFKLLTKEAKSYSLRVANAALKEIFERREAGAYSVC